ncbi:hypothetical protein ACN27G_27645 [Plantactinospora sp. WMMB334]|uniref:hypothetical protein n=1 Tax=Plantactinospora sp. WMMB334 TaxID=3404119 RepID=UPI003B9513C7
MTTPTTGKTIRDRIAAFKAAVDQLAEQTPLQTSLPEGCGLCHTSLPDQADALGAWTVRVLAEDLRWRVADNGPVATMPACTYVICPPCEMAVIDRDVTELVDMTIDNALDLNMPAQMRAAARSEVAAFYFALVDALSEPRPLVEANR